jgi:3',5'-cyclic AMP phosphodiesterase CpdA
LINSFFDAFYADANWQENEVKYSFERNKLYSLFVFHNQQISFIGLNSCIDECELPPHYGNITVEQCKAAFEELNILESGKVYKRIVVMHHNFIRSSANDEENLKDADEMLPIFVKNNVNIILHGHQHITQNHNFGTGNTTFQVLASGECGA